METGKEMSDIKEKDGLYWTPHGGNNVNDIWASCHTFSSVTTNDQGKREKTTVIVDLGQNEIPSKFARGEFDKVVPALNDCLSIPHAKAVAEQDQARALFLTHSHSDHIEGVFEYLRMGVKLPPVYASQYTLNALTAGFINRQIDSSCWPEMREIKSGETIEIGNMKVDVFPASHSIPGAFSFKISNADTSVFHSGDTKADESSYVGSAVDLASYEKIGKEGGVDLMTFDATATHLPGHATYESEVFKAYSELFGEYDGRQIIAALPPAHMERLATVVSAAQAAGKDVIIDGGPSLERNILALQSAGYDFKEICPEIKVMNAGSSQAQKSDPEKCVTITTGVYLEKHSPFVRKIKGEESSFVLKDNAVVVVPTSGDRHEKLHKELADAKTVSGLTVVTSNEKPGIYGSGHAQSDDFKKLASLIRPKKVVPIHCSKKMSEQLNTLARQTGYSTFKRPVYNGETVHVSAKSGCEIVRSKEPSWYGIKHMHGAAGGAKTVFARVSDYGYSRPRANTRHQYIEQRRREAGKKLAAYHDNRVKNNLLALRKAGNGR